MPIFSYLRKFHALKIKAPSIVERKTKLSSLNSRTGTAEKQVKQSLS